MSLLPGQPQIARKLTERRSYEEMVAQALFKLTEVVLQSRVGFQPDGFGQVRERPYFNLDVESIDLVRDRLACLKDNIQFQVRVDIFTTLSNSMQNMKNEDQVGSSTGSLRSRVLLETWTFGLNSDSPLNLSRATSETTELRRAWDRITHFMRSLSVYTRILPAFGLYKISRDTTLQVMDFVLTPFLSTSSSTSSLAFATDSETETHQFPGIDTPIGRIDMGVIYARDLTEFHSFQQERLMQYDHEQQEAEENAPAVLETGGTIHGIRINQDYVPRPGHSPYREQKHTELSRSPLLPAETVPCSPLLPREKSLPPPPLSLQTDKQEPLRPGASPRNPKAKPRWMRWAPSGPIPASGEGAKPAAGLEPASLGRTRSTPRAIPGTQENRSDWQRNPLEDQQRSRMHELSIGTNSISPSPTNHSRFGRQAINLTETGVDAFRARSAPITRSLRSNSTENPDRANHPSLLTQQLRMTDHTVSHGHSPQTALGLLHGAPASGKSADLERSSQSSGSQPKAIVLDESAETAKRRETITLPGGTAVMTSPIPSPSDATRFGGSDSPVSTGFTAQEDTAIARRHSNLSDRSDGSHYPVGTVSQQSIHAPLWGGSIMRRSSMSSYSITPFKDYAGDGLARTMTSGALEYSPPARPRSFTPTPPLEPSSAPVRPSRFSLGGNSLGQGPRTNTHWRAQTGLQTGSMMRSSYSLRRSSATSGNLQSSGKHSSGTQGVRSTQQEIIGYILQTVGTASTEDVVPWSLNGLDRSNPFEESNYQGGDNEPLPFGTAEEDGDGTDELSSAEQSGSVSSLRNDPLEIHCRNIPALDMLQTKSQSSASDESSVANIRKTLSKLQLHLV